MKKSILYILIPAITIAATVVSCKKFLDYQPKGTISSDQLNTPDAADKLVIAAYAGLGNDERYMPYTSLWLWGSIRSDDAYKGGGSQADGNYDDLETFASLTPSTARSASLFPIIYQAISRCNEALRHINNLTLAQYPQKNARAAECRFIRGHFFFLLKTLYKYPPLAFENVSADSLKLVSNRVYTNDQLWDKIAEDFQYGVDNLPATQTDIGRANKYAAMAYLAKTRLYQAYEQNEQNAVTNINATKLNQVVTLTDAVINSGKYMLFDDFAKNFLYANENGSESIFAVQYSINDGTSNGRLDFANSLNYNIASQYGCCWFHIPSQNLVNSFKTDATGLPQLDTYDATEMKDPADFQSNGVDPRLDHTAGIPGHPFKYDPNFVYNTSWARTPSLYGNYSSMKEIQPPSCVCLKKVGAFVASSKNTDIIRLDDVMLWKAEALIELGRQNEALPLINALRTRAKNSVTLLKQANGSYASNYRVDTYQPGVNCTWTQDYARKAMRFERRLEFAMES